MDPAHVAHGLRRYLHVHPRLPDYLAHDLVDRQRHDQEPAQWQGLDEFAYYWTLGNPSRWTRAYAYITSYSSLRSTCVSSYRTRGDPVHRGTAGLEHGHSITIGGVVPVFTVSIPSTSFLKQARKFAAPSRMYSMSSLSPSLYTHHHCLSCPHHVPVFPPEVERIIAEAAIRKQKHSCATLRRHKVSKGYFGLRPRSRSRTIASFVTPVHSWSPS